MEPHRTRANGRGPQAAQGPMGGDPWGPKGPWEGNFWGAQGPMGRQPSGVQEPKGGGSPAEPKGQGEGNPKEPKGPWEGNFGEPKGHGGGEPLCAQGPRGGEPLGAQGPRGEMKKKKKKRTHTIWKYLLVNNLNTGGYNFAYTKVPTKVGFKQHCFCTAPSRKLKFTETRMLIRFFEAFQMRLVATSSFQHFSRISMKP